MWKTSILGVLIIMCLAGCATMPAPEQEEVPSSTVTSEEPTETAPAPVAQGERCVVENDPSTGEITGNCAVGVLLLPSGGRELDQASYGLSNLIKAINDETKISVNPDTGVIPVKVAELASTMVPLLLVKPSQDLMRPEVQQGIINYVQRGGFLLIDGRWQGDIVPGAKELAPPENHQIMLYPYQVGSLPSQLRRMKIVDLPDRTAAVITNSSFISELKRPSITNSHMKLGVNLILYALTQGKMTENSAFDISKDPNAKEFLRLNRKRVTIDDIPEI